MQSCCWNLRQSDISPFSYFVSKAKFATLLWFSPTRVSLRILRVHGCMLIFVVSTAAMLLPMLAAGAIIIPSNIAVVVGSLAGFDCDLVSWFSSLYLPSMRPSVHVWVVREMGELAIAWSFLCWRLFPGKLCARLVAYFFGHHVHIYRRIRPLCSSVRGGNPYGKKRF